MTSAGLSVIIMNLVMNLKESIISSFFFHLILFLFMAAVSSYTTGFSGGRQNIVSVDLIMEEKDLPDAGIDSADEPPLTSGPPPREEVSLSNQAVNSAPEESKETPEPEKKVEAVTDPAKIENAEKPPAQTGGFNSLEYYQFILMHKKIFGQKAGTRVNELLGEALKVNKRHFYGGTAIVSLKFGPDGNLSEVLVDSESPELKAFLEEISWVTIPAPAQYSLGFTGVQIEFTVVEGYMRFKIDAL
jgi:hypothetical protein